MDLNTNPIYLGATSAKKAHSENYFRKILAAGREMIERDRASANAIAGFGHPRAMRHLMVNIMGIQWGSCGSCESAPPSHSSALFQSAARLRGQTDHLSMLCLNDVGAVKLLVFLDGDQARNRFFDSLIEFGADLKLPLHDLRPIGAFADLLVEAWRTGV